jgi:hypothetical protein
MALVRDRDEFRSWLNGRPRHSAVAVAARAALRAIPAIIARDPNILAVFRAASCAFVEARMATKHELIAPVALAASRDAYRTQIAYSNYPTSAAAAGAASEAAMAASELSMRASDFVMEAVRSATSANATNVTKADGIITVHADAAWSAVEADCALLENGTAAELLMRTPLLHDGDWRSTWLVRRWQPLADYLNDLPGTWSVWTDWYEARLRGEPIDDEMELSRVLSLTEAQWAAGPSVANAAIHALAQSASSSGRPALAQLSSAPRFENSANGKIDLQRAGAVPDDAAVLRAELIRKTQALVAAIAPHAQDDRREIRLACERIAQTLTNDHLAGAASAAAIWSFASSLRSKFATDQARRQVSPAVREREEEPDPLPVGLGNDLADIIRTLGQFSSRDPDLAALEALEVTSVQAEAAKNELDAAGRAIARSASREDNLVTTGVADVLSGIADDTGGRIDPKTAVIEAGAVANFVAAAIKTAAVELVTRPEFAELRAQNPEAARAIAEEARHAALGRADPLVAALDANSRELRQQGGVKAVVIASVGGAVGTLLVSAGEIATAWIVANAAQFAILAGVCLAAGSAYLAVFQIAAAIARHFRKTP